MHITKINSVAATAAPDVYTVGVTGDIGEGEEDFDFSLVPGDEHGLAPVIRPMVADWIAEDKPVQQYVAPAVDLHAYAAAKRYEIETGGITVNGAAIDTSRDSQAMITGAYAYSQANPEETIQFKATSGWVTLDPATLAAIATAVGAHVQACFAVESTVAAGIEAGTITTTAEIDAADWPG